MEIQISVKTSTRKSGTSVKLARDRESRKRGMKLMRKIRNRYSHPYYVFWNFGFSDRADPEPTDVEAANRCAAAHFLSSFFFHVQLGSEYFCVKLKIQKIEFWSKSLSLFYPNSANSGHKIVILVKMG